MAASFGSPCVPGHASSIDIYFRVLLRIRLKRARCAHVCTHILSLSQPCAKISELHVNLRRVFGPGGHPNPVDVLCGPGTRAGIQNTSSGFSRWVPLELGLFQVRGSGSLDGPCIEMPASRHGSEGRPIFIGAGGNTWFHECCGQSTRLK